MNILEDKTLGYQFFINRSHPLSNSQGKVYLHRHVAMEKTGRALRPDEHVHHIDGDRKNNKPENLQIITPSSHAKIHHPATRTVRPCAACGEPTKNIKYCSDRCFVPTQRKVPIPSREDLVEMLDSMSVSAIQRKFGFKSWTSVQRWMMYYGISNKKARLAQSIERSGPNGEAAGGIPASGTIARSV